MRYLKYCGLLLATALLMPFYANAADQNGFQKVDIPDKTTFEESYFTANKMHMYLGLGSLLAAGLTGLTAPDSEGGATTQSSKNSSHAYFAYTAAALGGAAIVSGLWQHWDDVHLDNGIMDPDNLHMILAILGTAGYIYAISAAPKVIGGPTNGHAAAGMAGAVLMIPAIAFEW